MTDSACALGIFAKAPQTGHVKTRLCPPFTPEQAAEFYAVSLQETVARCSRGTWQTVIFYTGESTYFTEHFPQVPRIEQQGADLGERMEHALRTLLVEGYAAAALIGSDTPDLPHSLLSQAFSVLQQHDLVVAPSHDGGYVLIGERCHHPQLFDDIPWSTPQVLSRTRSAARRMEAALHELSPWHDVDDIDDLRQLIRRSPDSAAARWARTTLAVNPG